MEIAVYILSVGFLLAVCFAIGTARHVNTVEARRDDIRETLATLQRTGGSWAVDLSIAKAKAREFEDALAEAEKRAAYLKTETEMLHAGADKMEAKLDAAEKHVEILQGQRKEDAPWEARFMVAKDELEWWRRRHFHANADMRRFDEEAQAVSEEGAPSPEAEPTVEAQADHRCTGGEYKCIVATCNNAAVGGEYYCRTCRQKLESRSS